MTAPLGAAKPFNNGVCYRETDGALLIFGESEHMSPGFYAGAVLILLTILGDGLMKRRRLPVDIPPDHS